jgi:hypothetical protein
MLAHYNRGDGTKSVSPQYQACRAQPPRGTFTVSTRQAVLSTSLILLASATGCRTSEAQAAQSITGSYRCFTTSLQQVGAAPNARDRNEREKRGLPELERGQRATPIPATQMVMIMPAFFGNIEFNGRGTYRLTGSGNTGGYIVDRSTRLPTFTGDLKIMDVRPITGRENAFFLVYKDMAFECGLASAATAPVTASDPPRPQTPRTPPRPNGPPATAASFTGHFEGTYVCSQGETSMQLDTRAAAGGELVAVMSFGGEQNRPRGRYTLTGSWTGNAFRLTPEKWLDQPTGYVMTSTSGTLDGGAINGSIESARCGAMSLQKR